MKCAQFVLNYVTDFNILRGGTGSQTVGLTYYVIFVSDLSQNRTSYFLLLLTLTPCQLIGFHPIVFFIGLPADDYRPADSSQFIG